jgi:hypothetical protein
MRQLAILICILLSLNGCIEESKPDNENDQISEVQPQIRKAPKKLKSQFRFSDLKLFQPLNALHQGHFKKYGTFYSKDFAIYHINDQDAFKNEDHLLEVYLYYIDSMLYKIQALTTKNMASDFLETYGGSAKLVLNDKYNKKIAKTEPFLRRKNGRLIVNKRFTNYKIKWKNDRAVITYKVNENFYKIRLSEDRMTPLNIPKPKYTLTLESKTYEQKLAKLIRMAGLDLPETVFDQFN